MVKRLFPRAAARCMAGVLICGLLVVAADRGGAQNSDTTFGWLVSAPPLPQGAVRARTLAAGRDAVRLMRKRDGAALYARFNASMAQTVSQKTQQQILNGMDLSTEPVVGELVAGSLDVPIYYTLCPKRNGKWQEGIAITFDSGRADKIARVTGETQSKPPYQDDTIAFGRHVCDIIAKKDADGLYAVYSQPYYLKPRSAAELRDYLSRFITPEKPIGKRIGEVVAPASVEDDGSLMYVAEFAQGATETRKVILMFTPNHKKVTALFLVPGRTNAASVNDSPPGKGTTVK